MGDQKFYTRPFVGLLFANMFFWMSSNFFLPILPLYYHRLGMTDQQIGWAVGAYSLGAVSIRVIAGKLTDRYGGKPVIAGGILLSMVAIASYLLGTDFWSAMLARLFHGLGISVYASAALTTATFLHEPARATDALAMYTLFTMFGIGFAASTAPWLYEGNHFMPVVAAALTATALSFILYPKNPELRISPSSGKTLSIRRLMRTPGIYVPTLSSFGVNMCFGTVMTYLPLLFLSRGINDTHIFYVMYACSVIFTRFWVSRLCNWLTPQRLSVYILLGFALCMAVMSEFSGYGVLIFAGLSVGACYGLAYPTFATIVTQSTEPVNRGSAFGFFTMAVDGGAAAGAIGMGWMAAYGGYDGIFLLAAIYMVLYTTVYSFSLLNQMEKGSASAEES